MSRRSDTTSKNKLQVLKALRFAVKQHELQLRKCKFQLAPEFLNSLDELIANYDENNFDLLAQKFKEAAQLLEKEASEICSTVEENNEKNNQKTQETMNKAYDSLSSLLMSIKELLETNEQYTTLEKRYQKEANEHSKQMFAADDTFKTLVEEKNDLVAKTSNFRNEIRRLDLEQIAKLEETYERLQKNSSSLSHYVNFTLPEEHEKLNRSSHIDEIVEDSLNFLQLVSSTPKDENSAAAPKDENSAAAAEPLLGENKDHVEENKENNEKTVSEKTLSEIDDESSSITKEHIINELFGPNSESFLNLRGYFTPRELEGINKALEQRQRELQMIQRLGEAINTSSQDLNANGTNGITEIVTMTTDSPTREEPQFDKASVTETQDEEDQVEKSPLSQNNKISSPCDNEYIEEKKYAPHQVLSFQHNTQ